MLKQVKVDMTPAGTAPPHRVIRPAEVHKVSELSQLVTEVREVGKGYEFTLVASQWATRRSAAIDGFWAMECLRETCIYLAHTRHDVPRASAFIMTEFDFRELVQLEGPLPILRATTTILGTGCRPRQIRVQGDFLVNGSVTARASGIARILSLGAYDRLRRAAAVPCSQHMPLAQPLSPASTGAATSRDVLVAEDARGALYLALDTEHPVYFDHPTDHVPGMVLVEAAAQAVHVRAGAFAICKVRANFAQFVELGEPCEIRVQQHGRSATAFVYQRRSIAAEFTFSARTTL